MYFMKYLTKENLLGILIAILVVTLICFGIYFLMKLGNKNKATNTSNTRSKEIRCMIETSLMVAFAVILDLIFKNIPFLDMPMGGSASLTMLPIFVISFRRGPKWGIICGAVYSVINLLFDGKLYHWTSIFFDYLIAFGVLGIAGYFKVLLGDNKVKNSLVFIIGTFFATLGRFVCATLSGMIAFETPFVASMVYNAPYIFVSMIMCIIVLELIQDIILYEN